VTLVDRAAAPVDAGTTPAWRRCWGAPVGVHVAALALVLLALVPVVGTVSSFSADEGAAIIQARSLAGGDGWIVEHPVPEVDPTGASYPLENSAVGTNGFAPYAKHPLYPVLLAAADRAGGVVAMVLLSLAGTLAAAGLAAALARRIDPGLARPTVWVVGLASPLLFDGYLVMAHTLAAAAATGAVLLAVKAAERRSPALTAAVAPSVAAAVMLRTEAVFLAAALAATAVVVFRRRGLLPAAAAGAGALGAVAAEYVWSGAILGGAVAGGGAGAAPLAGSGLAGRVDGFVLTWLTTGYEASGLVNLALVAMLASTTLAAITVRRRPGETRAVVALSVTAAAAALTALLAGPANIVPGLVVAFPLLAAGIVLVDRSTLRTPVARLAAGTFALFALGVLATQYARGGSGEWGGRYFALGLPIAVPVLLAAIAERGRALAPAARRAAAGSLVVVVVSLASMGIGGLRANHGHNDAMNDAVRRATASVGGSPVVLAGSGTVARQGWPTFDEGRWLLDQGDAGTRAALLDRLAAAGDTTVVRVTRDPADVPGYDVVAVDHGGPAGRTWYVDVLRKR
jgi:hypothetical protein